MNLEQRLYQEQITRRPNTQDYVVVAPNGQTAAFDGYRNGVLLDAKYLVANGSAVRAINMYRSNQLPWEQARAQIANLIEEAQRQVRVARSSH